MRTFLLCMLLIAPALAGCIGTDDASDLEPQGQTDPLEETPVNEGPLLPNGAPAPASMDYLGCADQTTVLPVPASHWAPRLPEGLVPTTIDPAGQVALEVHPAYECTLPDNGTVGELWVFLLVEPPEAWANPEATIGHLYAAAAVTTSETSLETYTAWGYGEVLETGSVEVSITETPAGLVGRAAATGADSGISWEEHAVGPGPVTQAEPGLARVFAVENGSVVAAMDVSWPSHSAALNGQALFTIQGTEPPAPPPAWPALAELHLPAGHDFTLSYVDLPPLE